MAKSGMYLNGKELLECELEKLDRIDRLQSRIETSSKIRCESRRAYLDKKEPKVTLTVTHLTTD